MNNISNSKNYSKSINNMKKMNNLDDNIYFNLKPVSFYESKIKKENSKNNIEIEKEIITYEPNKENKKPTLKASLLYNSLNKKNNLMSYQDIALIKKKNNILENKKINEKQKNKNNNFFRLKRKKEIKQNSNNNNDIILNINNSSKFKPIMPMTLSTSSSNIKSFLVNTTKNILSKKNNLFPKNNEINNIKMKNNYINILQDKKEKKKYTNILRQINKDNIKTNLENKNLLKYEKISFDNLVSKSKSRISSSIASHRNYTPLNANKKNNKIFLSFHVQRSKSSGHFFDNNNNNIMPKTPNEQIIFQNDKRKLNNLFGQLYLGSTSRYNILGSDLINFKQRRIQTAKRLIN